MPYITVNQMQRYEQVSFDDIWLGVVDLTRPLREYSSSNTTTRYVDSISPKIRQQANIPHMIERLGWFVSRYEQLLAQPRRDLYRSFWVPKKSGGKRRIDEPSRELMNALRELKEIFETDMFVRYHTTAYAYIKNRSTVDALKRHQGNKSRWFLKTDFSDFFGSTTKDFILLIMTHIFPFCEILKDTNGAALLGKVVDLCTYNGGLPQGTPISPMLTNMVMIPIDHEINRTLRSKGFVYTRYADDIMISHRNSFNYGETQQIIRDILIKFNAPYKIKDEKTRYGSSSGKNWNLGLMLNSENDITIGHAKKKSLRAMIHNYALDTLNGKLWDKNAVQRMDGLISYYKMVEPSYVTGVLDKSSEQLGADIVGMIKADLRC